MQSGKRWEVAYHLLYMQSGKTWQVACHLLYIQSGKTWQVAYHFLYMLKNGDDSRKSGKTGLFLVVYQLLYMLGNQIFLEIR